MLFADLWYSPIPEISLSYHFPRTPSPEGVKLTAD